jgi:hypothetical protein
MFYVDFYGLFSQTLLRLRRRCVFYSVIIQLCQHMRSMFRLLCIICKSVLRNVLAIPFRSNHLFSRYPNHSVVHHPVIKLLCCSMLSLSLLIILVLKLCYPLVECWVIPIVVEIYSNCTWSTSHQSLSNQSIVLNNLAWLLVSSTCILQLCWHTYTLMTFTTVPSDDELSESSAAITLAGYGSLVLCTVCLNVGCACLMGGV